MLYCILLIILYYIVLYSPEVPLGPGPAPAGGDAARGCEAKRGQLHRRHQSLRKWQPDRQGLGPSHGDAAQRLGAKRAQLLCRHQDSTLLLMVVVWYTYSCLQAALYLFLLLVRRAVLLIVRHCCISVLAAFLVSGIVCSTSVFAL